MAAASSSSSSSLYTKRSLSSISSNQKHNCFIKRDSLAPFRKSGSGSSGCRLELNATRLKVSASSSLPVMDQSPSKTSSGTPTIVEVDLGNRSYPIYIGSGLLDQPDLLQRHIHGKKVLVVTNTTIAPLYLDKTISALTDGNPNVTVESVILPDGEQYKNMDTLMKVFDKAIESRLDRRCTFVALGGGVIGDMCGYAAASYLRGVNFIQIPTTVMAIVMKQQNRAEEAIDAIKSLRSRCSDQAQEALDNILLDLYKRCGRLDDQISLLRHKLFLIQQGMAFNGKRTKTARSQGKKFQVSVEQEATRLLGNLGWALMQQNNYIEAEDAYRRALVIAPDINKMCNLGICLMKQGRICEAKDTLRRVKPAVADGPRGVDSHLKAYERAQQMLRDLESEMMNKGGDRVEQSKLFDAFLGSSAIWQPQPCKEHTALPPPTTTDSSSHPRDEFADENINSNVIIPPNQKKALVAPPLVQKSLKAIFNQANLNIDAPPFYSSKFATDPVGSTQQHPETLKRTRSGNAANFSRNRDMAESRINMMIEAENKVLKQSISSSPENKDDGENRWEDLLPDNKEFEEAIIAAVLGSSDDNTRKAVEPSNDAGMLTRKIDKRLKVFQDITISLSPRA